MTISLLLIATGKYKKFVQPLLDGVKQYFLLNHEIRVHLFTDRKDFYRGDERVSVSQHIIPSYKFPDATLRRYEIFRSLQSNEYDEYMIYLDVDMGIVSEVGDEILKPIIAVLHPGYYNGGWGDTETTKESNAYVNPEFRVHYYAGGFQGGKRGIYYQLCCSMYSDIKEDERRGVMARWHDESHWNKLLCSMGGIGLSPSYCMPEAQWKRELWGVDGFKPIILALEKEGDIRE